MLQLTFLVIASLSQSSSLTSASSCTPQPVHVVVQPNSLPNNIRAEDGFDLAVASARDIRISKLPSTDILGFDTDRSSLIFKDGSEIAVDLRKEALGQQRNSTISCLGAKTSPSASKESLLNEPSNSKLASLIRVSDRRHLALYSSRYSSTIAYIEDGSVKTVATIGEPFDALALRPSIDSPLMVVDLVKRLDNDGIRIVGLVWTEPKK